MKEQVNRRRDWNSNSELDSVKVVITAMVPSIDYQAEGFLSSEPLESPKQAGDVMKYNAIFPLKAKNTNGAPTRITMPGLMQLDRSDVENRQFQSQYKRQTIELLITLVFGNEAITLGKATLLVTGEEMKTKQADLPIDTSKNTVLKLQKKSTFPMKRSNSLSSNKQGEIAPTSFKYDRRRRKYQIENDAVLRAYLKCVPSVSMDQGHRYQGIMSSTQEMQNQYKAGLTSKNDAGIPKVIIPKVGGDLSMGGSVYSNMGYTPSTGGSAMPMPIMDSRDNSGRAHQSRGRSHSNSRPTHSASVQGNGSIYSASYGRVPPPGNVITRQRSYSAPRQRPQFPQNGSGPDYSFSGNGAPGRSMSRGSSGHRQYGSPYESGRNGPISHAGSQQGYASTSTGNRRRRSASPHVYREY